VASSASGEFVAAPAGRPAGCSHRCSPAPGHQQLQPQLHLGCRHQPLAGPYSSRQRGPELVGGVVVVAAFAAVELPPWLDGSS